NTDVKLRAPVDAQTLMRKLGLTPGAPPALEAHRPRNPAATHLSAARFNKPGSSRMPANVQGTPRRARDSAGVWALYPCTVIPAARPARAPAGDSSSTTQRLGCAPICLAAYR